jgi:hypothetical protein
MANCSGNPRWVSMFTPRNPDCGEFGSEKTLTDAVTLVLVSVFTTLVKFCDSWAGMEPAGNRLVKLCAICPGRARSGRRSPKAPLGVTVMTPSAPVTVLKPEKTVLRKPPPMSSAPPVNSPTAIAWFAAWKLAGNSFTPAGRRYPRTPRLPPSQSTPKPSGAQPDLSGRIAFPCPGSENVEAQDAGEHSGVPAFNH